jgi:hypothetical protein
LSCSAFIFFPADAIATSAGIYFYQEIVMSNQQKVRHVSNTGRISVDAPPERVFPLFGPVREAEWVDGWNPEILYSESPLAEEEGAVFATHRHGQAATIWVITRYERENYRVEYAHMTPGMEATRILIRCEAAPGGKTTAHVEYQVTTLDDSAPVMYEAHFPEAMAHWEQLLNKALSN